MIERNGLYNWGMSIPQPTREQARANLIHAALMFAMHEQLMKSGPVDVEPDDSWQDQELTNAVLTYLPHVSILAAKVAK